MLAEHLGEDVEDDGLAIAARADQHEHPLVAGGGEEAVAEPLLKDGDSFLVSF